MNVEIRQSFEKDALRLPLKIQNEIADIIAAIETAAKLSELKACKKLTGYKTAYRIRIGNYRIGFFFENNAVELVRALARKDIYRYFP
jgi:mRNA interferase RelE/StbE